MSLFLLCCVVLPVLTLVYLWQRGSSSSYVLPPGPRGIPVLGNALQIAKEAPSKFSQWAHQYGKLYTIYLGRKPALVVNDAALIKQLFGMTASAGKFSSPLLNIVYDGASGVVNSNGRTWYEQRQFCVKALRNCGFGRSSVMEPLILEELDQLCADIMSHMGSQGKVYLSHILKTVMGNIMMTLCTGERQNTPVAPMLEQFMNSMQRAANSGLVFYPWIKYLAPNMSGYNEYAAASKDLRQFLWKFFEDRQRSGEYDKQDLISMFLKHATETTDEQSSFYRREGLKQCFNSLLALLLAGTETTASTMQWIIFYLSVHPDVQAKVKAEIEGRLGREKLRLEDRSRMPYTEAVIEESLRMSSIAAYGLIHELLEDVSFGEYKLPQGTYLIANLYHAHHDPAIWGDPQNFRPERFLEKRGTGSLEGENGEGNTYLKNNVIAFQPGKRTCLGEPLARDTLFLAVVKLVQTFTFRGEEGRQREEYMAPIVGIGLLAKNLPVIAKAHPG